jgi:hypothetical protein
MRDEGTEGPEQTVPVDSDASNSPTGSRLTKNILKKVSYALETSPPRPLPLLVALIILAVGSTAAYFLHLALNPSDFRSGNTYAPVAALFLLALAVERLLEPFSGFFLPSVTTDKREYRKMAVEMMRTQKTAAYMDLKHDADRSRASRAVLMWGVASVLAMLVAASTGFFVMRSVEGPSEGASTNSGGSGHPVSVGPNRVLDLVLTGLIIGGGTKPLHDLIGRIQTATNSAKDVSPIAEGPP